MHQSICFILANPQHLTNFINRIYASFHRSVLLLSKRIHPTHTVFALFFHLRILPFSNGEAANIINSGITNRHIYCIYVCLFTARSYYTLWLDRLLLLGRWADSRLYKLPDLGAVGVTVPELPVLVIVGRPHGDLLLPIPLRSCRLPRELRM